MVTIQYLTNYALSNSLSSKSNEADQYVIINQIKKKIKLFEQCFTRTHGNDK